MFDRNIEPASLSPHASRRAADASARGVIRPAQSEDERHRLAREEPASLDADGEGRVARVIEFLIDTPFDQLAAAVMLVMVFGLAALLVLSPRDATKAPLPAASAGDQSHSMQPATTPGVLHLAPRLSFEASAPAARAQPIRIVARVADAHDGDAILVSGLAPGFTLSAGEPVSEGWRLSPADLATLEATPPKDFIGPVDVTLEMRDAAGRLESRTRRLEWIGETPAGKEAAEAPAPQAAASPIAEAAPVPREKSAAEPTANLTTPAPNPDLSSPSTAHRASVEKPAVASSKAQIVRVRAAARAPAAAAQPAASGDSTASSACVAKLDGKLLLFGRCQVLGKSSKRVTFEAGEKRFTVTFDHGSVWRLNYAGQDVGKVFERNSCWGSERAYLCDHRK
jgi:hypothetical protein